MMATNEEQPATINDVITPCLLLDVERVQRNAQGMIDKCQKLGIKLRPHMKTHKCWEVGGMVTGGTRKGIVVSTLREAEYFADGDFDDILWASVFTQDKLPRMRAMAERLQAFHVMIDNKYGLDLLESDPLDQKQWSVFLKVDCGGKRSGVLWDCSDDGMQLAGRLDASPFVRLTGVYSHEGNSYMAQGDVEMQAVANETTDRILQFAEKLASSGVSVPSVSVGATPTASKPTESLRRLTELHPGNYVFYDVQQHLLGSCSLSDVAMRVATRVKGHFPHRNELLVDAGFTALTHDGKDCVPCGGFCLVDGHPNLRVRKLTQEVGYVSPVEGQLNFDDYPLGSLLFLLPYHACATATRHRFYYAHHGSEITGRWDICHGW